MQFLQKHILYSTEKGLTEDIGQPFFYLPFYKTNSEI